MSTDYKLSHGEQGETLIGWSVGVLVQLPVRSGMVMAAGMTQALCHVIPLKALLASIY